MVFDFGKLNFLKMKTKFKIRSDLKGKGYNGESQITK